VSEASLHFGPLELRPQERRLLVDGQAQVVGARAFDILLALVQRRERVVTKSELLEIVWPDTVVEESNLPVHVSALRRLLGTNAISTIPGRGYRFTLAADADPTPQPAASDDPTDAAPALTAPPLTAIVGRFEQAFHAEPLVGREEAVYDLVAHLLDHRLVTIVGAGGIGKTRLARAVFRRLREDFVDGVWWADLAPLQYPRQLPRAIAQCLGEPIGDDVSPAGLARAIAHRERMLLVLDNCEQVAAGVARLVAALLDELPRVRLLLTSRVPLHLPAELVWRLDALPVPAVGATLDEARGCGAFELFELRARNHDHRFAIDQDMVPAAIELCRRLEGHPLAIEMAAARAPQIGLTALLDRLGDRLRLLRASDALQPERQLSLRATLDWSCSLLDESQRTVLRRLSVFVGRFGLEAAQQVAADDQLDEWAALDALTALVEHSLVQAETPVGAVAPRYRLVETTRIYAREQLDAREETPNTLARYGAVMARVADQAAETFWRLPQAQWLERSGPDQDDLQRAFDLACAECFASVAARTGQALATLDSVRGAVGGARERQAASRALLATDSEGDRRTKALLWNLIAPAWSLEQPLEVEFGDAGARVAAWRDAGDARELYLALRDLIAVCVRSERPDDATRSAREMSALEDPTWPPALRSEGAQARADLRAPGVNDDSIDALARAVQIVKPMVDARREAWLCLRLALHAAAAGPAQDAVQPCRMAVEAFEGLRRPLALGCAWSMLCAACLFTGDRDAARRAAVSAYPLLQSSPYGQALFHQLALLEARAGRFEPAAQLLAHAESSTSAAALWQFQPVLARLRQLAFDAIPPSVREAHRANLDSVQADELAWAVLGGREAVGI
jgi:predicted ATPase/DNA-binding winged helix-turn-helix (wHTH) protein